MKKTLAAVLFCMLAATAQAADNPFETTDESRQRHSAERYDAYKSKDRQAPLGNYHEKLGDPAPKKTETPGYQDYKPYEPYKTRRY